MKAADQVLEEAISSLISPPGVTKPWLTITIDCSDIVEYGAVTLALTQALLQLVQGEKTAPAQVQPQLDELVKCCGKSSLARCMTPRRLRLAVEAQLVKNTVLYRKVTDNDPPSYVIFTRA